MRSPLVVGNWKMHKDTGETASFFNTLHGLIDRMAGCDIVVCPPFVGLEAAVRAVRGTRIRVGAQNLHWAKEGAYTGEVSALMIRASGCSYVIVGSSCRRLSLPSTRDSRRLFAWENSKDRMHKSSLPHSSGVVWPHFLSNSSRE